MAIRQRCTAEISRSWDQEDGRPSELFNEFDRVIANNAEGGYELESWQTLVAATSQYCRVTETIIAVFVVPEVA